MTKFVQILLLRMPSFHVVYISFLISWHTEQLSSTKGDNTKEKIPNEDADDVIAVSVREIHFILMKKLI